jgi:hypothetical protein
MELNDVSNENNKHELIIPRPFAFAIDDLGWNNGSNIGANGASGPYRVGVNKKMEKFDYEAIVEVGKTVGVRIQALFILCEMDRANVCAKYPTSTMHGKDWNNSKNICDAQIEIMNYVKENAAFLEFGLHGVGHEYWPKKMQKVRAEWYNKLDKKPWPEEILNDHIQCFKEIMAQYDLTPENGHSFPESFCPPSYSFYWNPNGDYSLGKILAKNGVKYANTDFAEIPELNPPKGKNGGGFDHGVHVVNRINYGNEWWRLSTLPLVSVENQESDMIETHWANWLAQDEFLQQKVNDQFIAYYRKIQQSAERYVAKNTEQFHSQWLYKKFTKVFQTNENSYSIDNTEMPDTVYLNDLLGNLVFKIKLNKNEHISSATINQKNIACYFEEEGYAFIYLPVLQKKVYQFEFSIDGMMLHDCVINDGTYNIYNCEKENNILKFDLKMYGKQKIKIRCNMPLSIHSSNNCLQINAWFFDYENDLLSIEVTGRDFQGERGFILVKF